MQRKSWMNRSRKLAAVVIAAVFALGAAGTAQAAIVVQDFSSFQNSGNYLDPTHVGEVEFSPNDPGSTDVTVRFDTGGPALNAVVQATYLSGEFPTYQNAGERLSVDLTTYNPQGGVTSETIGLAIASVANPSSRANIFVWGMRRESGAPNNALRAETFDGSGTTGNSIITGINHNNIDTLFIEKAANGWSFGTISGGVETFWLTDVTSLGGVNITADGSAVGLWTDLRHVNTTFTVSNFTVIPEPGSLALLGAGLGLMLLRRRRTA